MAEGQWSSGEASGFRSRNAALQNNTPSLVPVNYTDLMRHLPAGVSRDHFFQVKDSLLRMHDQQNGGSSENENVRPENDNPRMPMDNIHRSSRYKTELCRSYEEDGVCNYGGRCQFAHGHAELRSLPRHPKYKSELCRTFHSNGLCPYGHRCHFIHNQERGRRAAPAPRPANLGFADINMNNVRRNEALPDPMGNGWGRRASFSNFSSDTFRTLPPNAVMQAILTPPNRAGPPQRFAMPPTLPPQNGFKPLSNGNSLGSVGESPPISPIYNSPEDLFVSQTSLRHGYVPPSALSESSDSNPNPMMSFTKFPSSLVNPRPHPSAPIPVRPSPSLGNAPLNTSQSLPVQRWSNGDEHSFVPRAGDRFY